MRPLAHSFATSSPILILLVLTLTLGLPITAIRTNRPLQEHTQYLQLPVFGHAKDNRGAGDGPSAQMPIATGPSAQDDFQKTKGSQRTAYYRCPSNSDERCGWHVPVVKAEAPRGLNMGLVVAAVFGAAVMFTMGLV